MGISVSSGDSAIYGTYTAVISKVEQHNPNPIDGLMSKDEIKKTLDEMDVHTDYMDSQYLQKVYDNYDRIAATHNGQQLIDVVDLLGASIGGLVNYPA